ncbi:MAG: RluA family pseudouridine synthase [Bacillota bacterium]|jgi:23S rRNA pseudouridine1911/1915/1917 synthase
MDREQTIIVEAAAKRIDAYLADCLKELSRARIQSLLKSGLIKVDGKIVKPSHELLGGEIISLTIPSDKPLDIQAQEIDLDIIYEDSDIIVVNKPQGMVVHPAAGHYQNTLVNALLHHCQDLSGINGVIRPGIVHRIDKDTSGILVAAKNDAAHLGLSAQWKGHQIKRIYHTILHGVIAEPAGIIDAPIGRHPQQRKKMAVLPQKGRLAITHYKVLERFKQFTYAEIQLETGRTHQIRVHMSYLGHPVVGDPLYGPKKARIHLKGQLLHAKVLGFKHPTSGQWMEFTSDLPDYFSRLLKELRK